MTVTFSPATTSDDVTGFVMHCYDDHGHDQAAPDAKIYGSYHEAEQAYAAMVRNGDVGQWCCSIAALMAIDTDTCSVNVANANAAEILDALGYRNEDGSLDLVGAAEPDELLGRIMLARALRYDEGVPANVTTGSGGATLINCGRRPGYFADVFERLEVLAHQCQRLERSISWG